MLKSNFIYLSALIALFSLTGCDGLNSAYEGTFVTDSGVQLEVTSNGVHFSGLSRLGLADQSVSQLFNGFDQAMSGVKQNQPGIYVLLGIDKFQGMDVPGLFFGLREPEDMERMSGMVYSTVSSETYIMTEPKIDASSVMGISNIWEGSAAVFGFRQLLNPQDKVNAVEITFAPSAHIVAQEMTFPGTDAVRNLGISTGGKTISLKFKRVN